MFRLNKLSDYATVVMTLLARVGIATSKGMREKRRYAIVLAFVAAAFASAQPSYAEMKTKKVKATREQVAKARNRA